MNIALKIDLLDNYPGAFFNSEYHTDQVVFFFIRIIHLCKGKTRLEICHPHLEGSIINIGFPIASLFKSLQFCSYCF